MYPEHSGAPLDIVRAPPVTREKRKTRARPPLVGSGPRNPTAGSRVASRSLAPSFAADAPNRGTSSSQDKTILVVEDAPDTRRFFVVALEDAGYRVLSAESFKDALHMLRGGINIDAILVDYNLGDGSGAALIHQASNEGLLDARVTPALICTAYRYVELPPNVSMVRKPIGEADLLREIGRAFEGVGA